MRSRSVATSELSAPFVHRETVEGRSGITRLCCGCAFRLSAAKEVGLR